MVQISVNGSVWDSVAVRSSVDGSVRNSVKDSVRDGCGTEFGCGTDFGCVGVKATPIASMSSTLRFGLLCCPLRSARHQHRTAQLREWF